MKHWRKRRSPGGRECFRAGGPGNSLLEVLSVVLVHVDLQGWSWNQSWDEEGRREQKVG